MKTAIKKYAPSIAIIALICFTGWLCKYCYDLKEQVRSYSESKKEVTKQIQTEAKQIAKTVDEKGLTTALFDITKNIIPPTERDFAVNDPGAKGLIDTSAKILDVQAKQIKDITVINATLKAENLQLRKMLDASQRPYWKITQNGFDLTVRPPMDSLSNPTADIHGKFSFTAIKAFKKKWFLGAEKTLLAITSNSPYIDIEKVDYIGFEREAKQSGLRLQGQFNLDPATLDYGIGPGIRVDLGRLSLHGGYLRYPALKKWKYNVGANYDFVRF